MKIILSLNERTMEVNFARLIFNSGKKVILTPDELEEHRDYIKNRKVEKSKKMLKVLKEIETVKKL